MSTSLVLPYCFCAGNVPQNFANLPVVCRFQFMAGGRNEVEYAGLIKSPGWNLRWPGTIDEKVWGADGSRRKRSSWTGLTGASKERGA